MTPTIHVYSGELDRQSSNQLGLYMRVNERVKSSFGGGILPHKTSRLDCTILFLCRGGWLKAGYDSRPMSVAAGDCCVLFADHIVSIDETSPDFEASVLVLSREFTMRIRQMWSLRFKMSMHYLPVLHFTPDEQRIFMSVLILQGLIAQSTLPQAVSMSENLFGVTFALLHDSISRHHLMPKVEISPQEHLFERFHDLVLEHHRRDRQVQDYARRMGITPKYLAGVVKHITGRSANDWIDSYVVITSKILLGNDKTMSVQQVSDEMHFPDVAAFSKYFKRLTGMTPSAFRESMQ